MKASPGRPERAPGGPTGPVGLDERHEARNSQDASSLRSGSEAWIESEEGSKEERTPREGLTT
ncbi:hypothetical protein GCM10010498_27070 [Streptomyces cavourensis]|nr:hypothetical protein GCM10010498_27070 [Streptomyces cavourensis]